WVVLCVFLFQAEDGIRARNVTGVQTCALPIFNEVPNGSTASVDPFGTSLISCLSFRIVASSFGPCKKISTPPHPEGGWSFISSHPWRSSNATSFGNAPTPG